MGGGGSRRVAEARKRVLVGPNGSLWVQTHAWGSKSGAGGLLVAETCGVGTWLGQDTWLGGPNAWLGFKTGSGGCRMGC